MMDDPADAAGLEDLLGYRFRDRALLAEALTHASTQDGHNERLEFLGDAVLNLVVAEVLYLLYPGDREGRLTERKALLVARSTLERTAERLGLTKYLRIGGSLEGRPALPRSLLGNALEALLGAVFLDGAAAGALDRARRVALRWLEPEMSTLERDFQQAHAKQSLQHYAQRALGCLPRYEVLEHREHPEAVAFRVAAALQERRFPPMWGRSKKEAERWAAWEALLELRQEGGLAGG